MKVKVLFLSVAVAFLAFGCANSNAKKEASSETEIIEIVEPVSDLTDEIEIIDVEGEEILEEVTE